MYFQANRRYSVVMAKSGANGLNVDLQGIASLFDLTDKNGIEVSGTAEKVELGPNVYKVSFTATTEKAQSTDNPLHFVIIVDTEGGNVLYVDDNDEVCSTPIQRHDFDTSRGPLEMVQFDTHQPEWSALGVYWQAAREKGNGARMGLIMQNVHLLRGSHR